MGADVSSVRKKVNSFNQKYYLNLFVRGTLLTLAFVLAYFLLAAFLEYHLWLGKSVRLVLFALFFLVGLGCIILFLRYPLLWWIAKRGLTEEQSARMIGEKFPMVKDRLLNLLQLSSLTQRSDLLQASIVQKSSDFNEVSFASAVQLSDNKRYLKYLMIPFAFVVIVLIFDRGIITQSTDRIIQFNQEFSPQAPFVFELQNKSLSAFQHEDFTVSVRLAGNAIPQAAYLLQNGQRAKMLSTEAGVFEYTFEKIQADTRFQIEASGFYSKAYDISLVARPELSQMQVQLNYPSYLVKKREEFLNTGNLEVPEGTRITWKLVTQNANRASIAFSSENTQNNMQTSDNQIFEFGRNFKNPDDYTIILENDKSKNKDRIAYSINVVKDGFPEIVVNQLRDSILYKNVLMGGQLTDDYGIMRLELAYTITTGQGTEEAKRINVPVIQKQPQQNFYYAWGLDSLRLEPGASISYFLEVWDNDGVNGSKSSRSATYSFSMPTEQEIKNDIVQSQQGTESKIDESLKKAKDLKKSIDDAEEKLRGKQSLTWQDKNMLEDLLQQKKSLTESIEELKKENELLEKKKENLSQENERIKEKSEQIQKLMNELLDDETKKMFEQLEKMLKENADLQQMQRMLEKMERKEINLEKELERTLELFKQLQFDYKLDQSIEELKEQITKQESLLEKTDGQKKSDDSKKSKESKEGTNEEQKEGGEKTDSPERLAEEQEGLKEEFKEFKKSLKELEQLGEELDEDELPGDEEMEQIEKSQENSSESLKKGQKKKSAEHQKNTISQMKQARDKLEQMSSGMEMEMNMQNLESLKQIVHGLIKASYDQESLMKEFNVIQQTDPLYVQLGQNQLKLKDDVKVLEDSLLGLGKRDPFMGSVVTKEVGELNDHIDKSVSHVKDRRKGNASSEMQLSMASMNNLALMLNDRLDQMMKMMANMKPGKGKGKGKSKMPSLSQLQNKLNQQIQQMKNGSTPGRQMSEQLAKMAAEQERIRRALQEMQEEMKKQGGKGIGDDIPGKMEQTEMDLVNKQVTEQTIRRQQEIMTRLLEAEKSMREQNMDEERKGETAKDYSKEAPRAFEEYIRMKEKEIELLKTVPPKLYPYYKREVSDYFKRIENQK